jgi:hypothetical protein
LRAVSRIHATTAERIDGFDLHATAFGHAREKQPIVSAHRVGQRGAFFFRERAKDALGTGALASREVLDPDPEHAGQADHVDLAVEDADRAGQRRRIGPDLVRGARDVVATARGDRAHRGHYGFTFARAPHRAPDLVRGQCGASR